MSKNEEMKVFATYIYVLSTYTKEIEIHRNWKLRMTSTFSLMSRLSLLTVCLIGLSVLMTGCGSEESTESTADTKPYIVATTGMIADAVSEIVGDLATVEGLMGPGVDPHLYKATRGDLTQLRKAKVIFYNGLHLEGKMGEVLEKLSEQKPVYAVGEALSSDSLIYHGSSTDSKDPHIWFDVSMWTQVVSEIALRMREVDAPNQAIYKQRADAYIQKLNRLDEAVSQKLAEIPQSQRVLITAHDAFSYFGRAYGVEVRGLQGISTVSEFGLKDVSELVDFIVSRKIKAVFVESSIPTRSLEAVIASCKQQGHEVKLGGTLFSDAMGAADTPEGTYIGMVNYNVQTITEALK